MSASSIRDNYKKGSVGDFLKEQVTAGSKVSIVSAYFTIYAYYALRDRLDEIAGLRFLFGEPTFIKSLDPEKLGLKEYKIEDNSLVIPLEKRLSQKSVAQACQAWLKDKVEIRSMVKPNFLHGKLYHILQESGVEKAIAGSSNFTAHGLGLNGARNIELNLIVDSDRDREELKEWFDELWDDKTGLVEDVKDEVLRYLDQLYADNAPEFIYLLTLYHIFSDYLDDTAKGKLLDEKTGFFDSGIWNTLYNFQKDGVKGSINKILKHNGCIIADSVGLGKTYEALAVIKYFELLNYRVLVICPKKLSGNWTIYQASQNHALNPFPQDRFSYTTIYHTDLGRTSGKSEANGIDMASFNWGAYDLIVIDESHNFKGNVRRGYDANEGEKLNRTAWLLEKIIQEGVKTRVLLLSATPVNTSLKDLRNQISYITEGRDDALIDSCGIQDISQTLRNAQLQFTTWANPKKNPRRTVNGLMERLDSGFFKILDELTIARSRKHIRSFYNLDAIGEFPTREKPVSLYPEIDLAHRFPSYDSINQQILKYQLSVFKPSAYVKPELVAKYEAMEGSKYINFKQRDREDFLIAMMKINYLKRLESSIESFEISLDRTIRKIEALETRIQAWAVHNGGKIGDGYSIDEAVDDSLEEEEEDDETWKVGKKLKFDFADLDLAAWSEDLRKDKDKMIVLYNSAASVTREHDAKLALLKKTILEKVRKPFNEGNFKIIVFTAFADTAQYLYDSLKDWYRAETGLHCARVSGTDSESSFGKSDYDSILTNFSPLAKHRSQIRNAQQNGEIDLLIATDCISEGQNLQDCDFLINYDIHWNPVRIIQRFGRIDRLGSRNKSIRLVNFWPTRDLDSYINLKERVESRMALVDLTATGEDNILNTEQIQDIVSEDLKYRNRQLKRLQEEVLDLEDMDASISITDFSLDDFRMELTRFLEQNKKRLAQSPLGLYAIVPIPPKEDLSESQRDIVKPGIVFCLKSLRDGASSAQVNPLSPYYLAYVRDDGTVRYNFTSARQILELFRLLCQGKAEPHKELCDLFNRETDGGIVMEGETQLLKKAAAEIVRACQKREGQRVVTGGRSVLLQPTEQTVGSLSDFELVTWLIVREE